MTPPKFGFDFSKPFAEEARRRALGLQRAAFRRERGIDVRIVAEGAQGAVLSIAAPGVDRFAIKLGGTRDIDREKRMFRALRELRSECAEYVLNPPTPDQESVVRTFVAAYASTLEAMLKSLAKVPDGKRVIWENEPVDFAVYGMELLGSPWITLYKYMSKRPNGDAERAKARLILRNVQKAFQCLFKSGFAHRDAHDKNVMVQPLTGKVKIVDYGWMKRVSPMPEDIDLLTIEGRERGREWFESVVVPTMARMEWWWSNFTFIDHAYRLAWPPRDARGRANPDPDTITRQLTAFARNARFDPKRKRESPASAPTTKRSTKKNSPAKGPTPRTGRRGRPVSVSSANTVRGTRGRPVSISSND